MANEIKLEDLKDMVRQLGEDIKGIAESLEEDKNTNGIYTTELIRMLTEDTAYVKLLPIEQEVHNYRSHREEYFTRHEKFLDGINEKFQKISEYFDKKLA